MRKINLIIGFITMLLGVTAVAQTTYVGTITVGSDGAIENACFSSHYILADDAGLVVEVLDDADALPGVTFGTTDPGNYTVYLYTRNLCNPDAASAEALPAVGDEVGVDFAPTFCTLSAPFDVVLVEQYESACNNAGAGGEIRVGFEEWNADYHQRYALVDDAGTIVEKNDSGVYDAEALASGTYYVCATNFRRDGVFGNFSTEYDAAGTLNDIADIECSTLPTDVDLTNTDHCIEVQVFSCDVSLIDPCSCLDNSSDQVVQDDGSPYGLLVGGDDGTFSELISIVLDNPTVGEVFTVTGNTSQADVTVPGGFDAFNVPAIGSQSAGVPIATDGTAVLAQISLDGSLYEMPFVHIDALGYVITIVGPGGAALPVQMNNCSYPNLNNPLPIGPYCPEVPAFDLDIVGTPGQTGADVDPQFLTVTISNLTDGGVVAGPTTYDAGFTVDFSIFEEGKNYQLEIVSNEDGSADIGGDGCENDPTFECNPGCSQTLTHDFFVTSCEGANIPTASEWGLICLALGLLTTVLIYVRRREDVLAQA